MDVQSRPSECYCILHWINFVLTFGSWLKLVGCTRQLPTRTTWPPVFTASWLWMGGSQVTSHSKYMIQEVAVTMVANHL